MNSLGVGRKLQALFCVLLVLIGAQSIVMLRGFSSMRVEFDNAIDHRLALISAANRFEIAVEGMRSGMRGVLLYAKFPDKAAISRKLYADSVADAETGLSGIQAVATTPKTQAQLAEARQMFGELRTKEDHVLALAAEGKLDEAVDSASQLVGAMSQCIQAGHVMSERQSNSLAEDRGRVASEERSYQWMAALALLLSLAAAIITFLFIRRISRKLTTLSVELAQGAEQLAAASGQISASGQALAQGATEQAASLEETAASAEEVRSMTGRNAENSTSAAASMKIASERVNDGNRRLDELVTSMEGIGASSEKISKIIKTIDEIAFQTNILALNAAVEAARAGEAGMGFAVVADEVRSLAQRSAQAAKDTATLIEESIQSTQEGGAKVEAVAEAIRALTRESEQVKVLIEEVSMSSQEQSRGLQQITGAIGQMDQVTQRIAASSEESAAAGQELHVQSEKLNQLVSELATFIGGAKHTISAASAKVAPEPQFEMRTARPAARPAALSKTPNRTAPRAIRTPAFAAPSTALSTASPREDAEWVHL